MDELLAQLRAAGPVDSSARFTVDVLRAHRKLAQFQLADPGFYLLKLVQAAVALGAPAVAVRLGRQQVEVGFEPTEPLEGLPQALLEGRSVAGGLHHLTVALTGALACEPRELTFGVAGEYELRLHAEGLAALPPPQGELAARCYFRMVKTPPSGFFQRWFAGARANLAESAALCERCRFAPIPVLLDGRPVNAPFPETLAGLTPLHLEGQGRIAAELVVWAPYGAAGLCAPTSGQRQPAVVDDGITLYTKGLCSGLTLLRAQPPHQLPVFRPLPPRAGEYFQTLLEGESEVLIPRIRQLSADAVLTLPHAPVPALLVPVLDGVQLNPKAVDLIHGVVAVVAAPAGLATDASEFEAVEDERYQDLVDEVRGRVMELAAGLRPHVATWQAADRLYLTDGQRDRLRERLGQG